MKEEPEQQEDSNLQHQIDRIGVKERLTVTTAQRQQQQNIEQQQQMDRKIKRCQQIPVTKVDREHQEQSAAAAYQPCQPGNNNPHISLLPDAIPLTIVT